MIQELPRRTSELPSTNCIICQTHRLMESFPSDSLDGACAHAINTRPLFSKGGGGGGGGGVGGGLGQRLRRCSITCCGRKVVVNTFLVA